MWIFLKYDVWNVASVREEDVTELCAAGFTPLAARTLCARGYDTAARAKEAIQCDGEISSPFLMKEMDRAAQRVRLALSRGEKIAVFGDYDVDGITSTCLLTDYLRTCGGDCIAYIPGRLEEGYGLNEAAIRHLCAQGATLIVTVDCGITACEEAALCRTLGVDLVITDHHECKAQLPEAVAIVDPHRPDRTYPTTDLSGVGIAYQLACAVDGGRHDLLSRYCDLVCLGAIADVMPMRGENRVFVSRGLKALQSPHRVGLKALIRECGCDKQTITATAVGYTLAPRINAAGRMGCVELATELLLTEDPARAAVLAQTLCRLNRERQRLESEIYKEAVQMLQAQGGKPSAIVLANETWHQGIVGIVASRLAEEYACPTFLICLDGDRGKASSRSHGGFNLFASLKALSPLLESYGGHELAAGFTIRRENIAAFRQEMERLCAEFYAAGQARAALAVDCRIEAELLTIPNIAGLDVLEPCGTCFPRPVFCMEALRIEQLSEIGGGKHLRLRLRSARGCCLNAVWFSTTALRAAVGVGDLIDVAFQPQINEYRNERQPQLHVIDLRPTQAQREQLCAERGLYEKYTKNLPLEPAQYEALLPVRAEFVAVWRYLISHCTNGQLLEEAGCLSRKIARCGCSSLSALHMRICLDVFAEQELIELRELPHCLHIIMARQQKKFDLNESPIVKNLRAEAGETNGNLCRTL